MKLAATLGNRFAIMLAGRGGLLLISIAVMAMLSRELGPAGFGHYRAAVAYLGLFVLLGDFGLASIFVREISRPGADQARIVGNAMALRLATTVAIMLLALSLARVLAFDDAARLGILVGAIGFTAYSTHLLLFGLFQQRLRQHGVVAAELVGGAVLLAGVIVLGARDAEPAWFVGALAFSHLSTLAITVFLARRLVRFELRLDLAEWRRLMIAAVPLAGIWVLTVLSYRADSVLLALLSGPEAVGLYGVPIKVFESVMGMALLLVGLYAPFMAQIARSVPGEFTELLDGGLGVLCIGCVGVALGLATAAPELVRLLAGPEFSAAGPILRLLMLLSVAHAATLYLREAATALDVQQKLLPGYLLGLAVALLGFYALIPRFAGAGAAVTLLASEVLVLAFALRVLSRWSPEPPRLRLPALAVLCGGGASLVLLAVERAGWGLGARVAAPLAAYGALLFALGAVKPSEVLAVARQMVMPQRG